MRNVSKLLFLFFLFTPCLYGQTEETAADYVPPYYNIFLHIDYDLELLEDSEPLTRTWLEWLNTFMGSRGDEEFARGMEEMIGLQKWLYENSRYFFGAVYLDERGFEKLTESQFLIFNYFNGDYTARSENLLDIFENFPTFMKGMKESLTYDPENRIWWSDSPFIMLGINEEENFLVVGSDAEQIIRIVNGSRSVESASTIPRVNELFSDDAQESFFIKYSVLNAFDNPYFVVEGEKDEGITGKINVESLSRAIFTCEGERHNVMEGLLLSSIGGIQALLAGFFPKLELDVAYTIQSGKERFTMEIVYTITNWELAFRDFFSRYFDGETF